MLGASYDESSGNLGRGVIERHARLAQLGEIGDLLTALRRIRRVFCLSGLNSPKYPPFRVGQTSIYRARMPSEQSLFMIARGRASHRSFEAVPKAGSGIADSTGHTNRRQVGLDEIKTDKSGVRYHVLRLPIA